MKIPVLFAETTQVVFAQSDMQYGKVRYVQKPEKLVFNAGHYSRMVDLNNMPKGTLTEPPVTMKYSKEQFDEI